MLLSSRFLKVVHRITSLRLLDDLQFPAHFKARDLAFSPNVHQKLGAICAQKNLSERDIPVNASFEIPSPQRQGVSTNVESLPCRKEGLPSRKSRVLVKFLILGAVQSCRETAALWLSLAVPPDLNPGVYEGEVVVEPVVDENG